MRKKRILYEETGLLLDAPYLRGMVAWINEENNSHGLIFVYRCNNYSGYLLAETDEGYLSWIPKDTILSLNLFSINKHFIDSALTSSNFFEGKFFIDKNTEVLRYEFENSKYSYNTLEVNFNEDRLI